MMMLQPPAAVLPPAALLACSDCSSPPVVVIRVLVNWRFVWGGCWVAVAVVVVVVVVVWGGKCPTTLCRRRLNATPAPLQGFSVTGCNMTHDQIQCNNPRYPHCLLFMEGGTDGGYIAHNHFQMGCCSFCGEKRTPQCMQTPRCFQCAGLFAPRWNVLRRIVRLQCKRGHTGGQPVL